MSKTAPGKIILTTTLLLMAFGVLFVYSSSYPTSIVEHETSTFFLKQHLQKVIAGLGALFLVMKIPYRFLQKVSPISYWLSIVMLLAVLLFGRSIGGAKRWLDLGIITFQVSEFARIALLIMVASQLAKLNDVQQREWKEYLVIFLKAGLVLGLIVLEPDYSTTMVQGIIVVVLIFAAGIPKRVFYPTLLIIVVLALLVGVSEEYRRKRIIGFFQPEKHTQNWSFQPTQALIGIGNGGVWGVGIGEGNQKHHFLPEAHTDFMFSILGEELGFIRMTVLVILYGLLVYQGFQVALQATDRFGQLLAFGISLAFGLYFVLHSLVNLRWFPTTGVPLPFISYGGMSFLFTAISIGILLNIASEIEGE